MKTDPYLQELFQLRADHGNGFHLVGVNFGNDASNAALLQDTKAEGLKPLATGDSQSSLATSASGETTEPFGKHSMEALEMMKGWEKALTPELEKWRQTHSSPRPRGIEDYLGAWRGFRYNLDQPCGVTWVAYLTTSPATGFLYQDPANLTSGAIKMAMTVQITDRIYCPLGIYTSPIGYFADLDAKVRRGSKSMLLHAGVANLVNAINPGKVDLAVLRPLHSMHAILAKSDIPCSQCTASTAIFEGINRDLITDAGTFNPASIKELGYEGNELVLVEPVPKKMHFIAATHWFAANPFLGRNHHNWHTIGEFPYVLIRRADLAKTPEGGNSAEADRVDSKEKQN